MGNIHREVCPLSVKSPVKRLANEVKIISIHQPVMPQIRKSFNNSFIEIFIRIG